MILSPRHSMYSLFKDAIATSNIFNIDEIIVTILYSGKRCWSRTYPDMCLEELKKPRNTSITRVETPAEHIQTQISATDQRATGRRYHILFNDGCL
jgi:hypothetical protein